MLVYNDIAIKTKTELKEITIDDVSWDISLKSHLDKLESVMNGCKTEIEHYKKLGKAFFGDDGGNKVFHTETTYAYLLDTDELINLIGIDKYNELKTKIRKTTTLSW